MTKSVFEGVKALGFVMAGVGPMVLKALAEHGATAVRIESMVRPCNLRLAGPFKDNTVGINTSGFYAWFNSDKYSIALNLKHPRAKEVTTRLVKWADVIVENYAPGRMVEWGMSYEHVRKIKPDIVMISLAAMGQTGPFKHMPAYGAQLQGVTGHVYLTGWPDREPSMVDQSYPDFIAPRFGTVALLAALDYRRRTGKGQYIDLSQYEDALHFLAPVLLDYEVNKRIQIRAGNKCYYAAPHGSYRCKGDDRWCAIAVFTDEEWQALCSAMGKPELAKDARFSSLLARKENEAALNQLVEEWTVKHTAKEIMTKLQADGVAAGMVQKPEDVIEHCPQMKHRRFFQELDHPEIGKHIYARTPFLLSKTPGKMQRAAPCLGEHTEYVCRELLGLSEAEYDELLVSEALQ